MMCTDRRASPVFLLYTIGMNAIPGAFAVAAAATHWRNDCDKNLSLWLVVTAVVFNLFMIGLQAFFGAANQPVWTVTCVH